ncbi:MAG TPA: peptidylprolyl isomerase [Psychrobacter pasteurii]|uniref:Peptidyl-prolyl cis-trans isomerase n=1 Tax=Psychrobacter pasteurii TaxID=1945520 RepID=A0A1R4EGI3_9GAMM|nr:peptidylprolyl isomerase [Psychrobacter pasteurii]SJM37615.1 FKBP-type peptidyl-prolyl cis-trans isomerase SlyD [Psychrobacter pasteurii]HJH08621.1 peptidylprolyl isomerase [Psychrobacter pasteurii]
MTTIAKDTAVRFNYILKDESGNVIDQSQGEPLAYLHGHNNIIPGLEKELEGKSAGDSLTAVIEPADAYGEYQEQAVQQVPRANFQGVDNIQPGMQFQSEAEGQVMLVTVTDVNEDTVTVDANHPLAGKKLSFDVEIVEVRAATEDELNHGHVHGVGGVQH